MTRHLVAIGLVAVVSSWTVAGRADDAKEEKHPDAVPSPDPGASRGINPVATSVPATPPPTTGTTTTTASTLGVTSGASTAPAAEPKEERELVRPHRSMLITGSAILVGSYAASAIVGGISDTEADKRLFVPLVGPWLDLADRSCQLGNCGVREDINILHIIGSGAAQATGLGIAIASLFVEERRDGRPAPQRPAPEPPRTMWRVVPMAGGLGAIGTF